MYLIHRVHTAVTMRLRRSWLSDDRGDSPVPSAVIILGLAVIAVALLGWLGTYVAGLLEQAPEQLPDPGFGAE